MSWLTGEIEIEKERKKKIKINLGKPRKKEREISRDSKERKEMFYLTMNSRHYIYNYMASDIW